MYKIEIRYKDSVCLIARGHILCPPPDEANAELLSPILEYPVH